MWKQKKVLLMTATGSYNLGDELILSEEFRFLQEHYKNTVSFSVFTHDKKSSFLMDPKTDFVTYFPHNIRWKPFSNIWYFFKNIWLILHSDILIIGGGGIIFDNERGVNFSSLLAQWFLRTKIARLNGTTIVYLGISLEVKQVRNKMQLKKIFQKWDFIIVRDEQSASLLDALQIPSSQIPDLAFLYQPQKKKLLPGKKRVGISVRWWFLAEADELWITSMYEYLKGDWYDPVFLLHTTSGDDSQNDSVFLKRIMTGKTYHTTGTIEGTLKVYPTLYAVIGMRFHSLVLASAHGIPFLSISYGPKTKELLLLMDVPQEAQISTDHFHLESFKTHWKYLTENYSSRQMQIQKKHIEIRNDLILKLQTL